METVRPGTGTLLASACASYASSYFSGLFPKSVSPEGYIIFKSKMPILVSMLVFNEYSDYREKHHYCPLLRI